MNLLGNLLSVPEGAKAPQVDINVMIDKTSITRLGLTLLLVIAICILFGAIVKRVNVA